MTLSTSLAALSRQVLGLQHLRALTVACTRVVTLDTLRIITFPRLLKFSMTPVLIPWGQAPVGAYEWNACDSSRGLGLQSGTQQAEGSVHCPRAPTLEPSSKRRAPTQEPAPSERKSKVVSCRPRASHSSSQGRDVGLALSGLRFLALPVGRSGWPVLVPLSLVAPGCFPGRPGRQLASAYRDVSQRPTHKKGHDTRQLLYTAPAPYPVQCTYVDPRNRTS